MQAQQDFKLEKWYLDCVTPDGEAFIGYSAKLNWGPFALPYSSLIRHTSVAGTNVKTKFSTSGPIQCADIIKWSSDPLNLKATWVQKGNPLTADLIGEQPGGILWNCYQPVSEVTLEIDGQNYSGSGYVEKLEINIKPWEIEIQTLRWGRFISEKDNLVWIQINKKTKDNWLWYNGEFISNSIISDSKVELTDHKKILNFKKSVVIESEKKIFQTFKEIARFIPGIKNWIPSSFLLSNATKYLSRGTMNDHSEGWIVHEFIDFRPDKLKSFQKNRELQEL